QCPVLGQPRLLACARPPAGWTRWVSLIGARREREDAVSDTVERPVERNVGRRSTRPGARRRRRSWRRARGLSGTVGVTAMSALLPGSGYLWSGRRKFGLVVLLVSLALASYVG